MPKLVHSLPKLRHHKPSGRAVVTLNGRDHYLGPYGSPESQQAYERLIGEHLARKRQPDLPRGDMTVDELVIRYWEFAESYYVKNGQPTGTLPGLKIALRFLRKHYGPTEASQFGPVALESLRQRMVEAGLSRSYVNENVAQLKRAFKWAASKQLLPVGVFQALQTVSGLKKGRTEAREPDPIGPVPDEVVDATLPYLPAVVADMVRFQQRVGCRPGEVCQLRPCDVDRSEEVWCFVPETHKTEHRGKQRRIFIGPKAQAIITPYLLRDHEAYCFSPKESREKQLADMRAKRKTPVQPSQVDRSKKRPLRAPGDSYNKDSYNHAIRRAVDKANKEKAMMLGRELKPEEVIPYWHPNQLRHAVATEVRRQFGIEAAQTVLGHSHPDVTLVYAERDFGLAREIMKRIG